jgi:hypothetical protein
LEEKEKSTRALVERKSEELRNMDVDPAKHEELMVQLGDQKRALRNNFEQLNQLEITHLGATLNRRKEILTLQQEYRQKSFELEPQDLGFLKEINEHKILQSKRVKR